MTLPDFIAAYFPLTGTEERNFSLSLVVSHLHKRERNKEGENEFESESVLRNEKGGS